MINKNKGKNGIKSKEENKGFLIYVSINLFNEI